MAGARLVLFVCGASARLEEVQSGKYRSLPLHPKLMKSQGPYKEQDT